MEHSVIASFLFNIVQSLTRIEERTRRLENRTHQILRRLEEMPTKEEFNQFADDISREVTQILELVTKLEEAATNATSDKEFRETVEARLPELSQKVKDLDAKTPEPTPEPGTVRSH